MVLDFSYQPLALNSSKNFFNKARQIERIKSG